MLIVGRLKELFASWEQRDLAGESYPIVFLDGFHLKVRLARKVVTVPVLAALGVAEDGTKVLVGLRLAVSEASGLWNELLTDPYHAPFRERFAAVRAHPVLGRLKPLISHAFMLRLSVPPDEEIMLSFDRHEIRVEPSWEEGRPPRRARTTAEATDIAAAALAEYQQ